MGYEIAGGLGVKLADPDRNVYVLCGDGSFLMASSELVTAVQERIAFTVVVFDNHEHRSIRACQENNGFEVFGTQLRMRDKKLNSLCGDILPIDYAKIAEGYGAVGLKAKTREELISALKQAQEVKDKPAVIHVLIDPDRVVGNYGGWWDVPRPEVAYREELQRQYRKYVLDKKKQIIR